MAGYKVIPLDINISLERIKNDIYNYIDLLNKLFINSRNNGKEHQYLYRISYQIEGGIQGEILNLIMHIDFMQNLLKRHQIDQVIFYENEKDYMIKNVLKELAPKYDFQIKIFGKVKWRLRSLFYMERYVMNVFMYCIISRIRIICFYVKQLAIKENKGGQFFAGFIICSNAKKHINWSLPIIKEFNKAGICKVICIGADKAVNIYKEHGIDADCIENYLTVRDFVSAIRLYYKDYERIAKSVYGLEWRGFDFYPLLYRELIRYTKVDVLKRYLIDICAKKFFERNSFDIIREWGDSNFFGTQVVAQHCKKDTIFFKEDYIYSFHVFFRQMDPIYEDYKFKCCKEDFEQLLKEGKKQERCFLINSTVLVKKYNKSRKGNYNKLRHILYAPSNPTPGYGSFMDFVNNSKDLINYLGINGKKCRLSIKLHPNENRKNIRLFQNMIHAYPNIDLISKDKGIEETMKDSDMVITDISTVILDAIAAKRPVICITGESEYYRVKDITGIVKCKNAIEVCHLLEKFFMNEKIYKGWALQSIEQQNSYFEENFIHKDMPIDSTKEIVKILYEAKYRHV